MTEAPVTPEELRETHPRLRADRLRAALRATASFPATACERPGPWIELLEESDDPAFRVLLLELLEEVQSERLTALLDRLRRDRAEGVRLASLRLLCDRQPERIAEFAQEHARDGNLELRVLVATRMFDHDRSRGTEMLLATLEEEAGGLRERHALERVLGFLVEERRLSSLRPRLAAMREDFDDPEDYFGWALAQLEEMGG